MGKIKEHVYSNQSQVQKHTKFTSFCTAIVTHTEFNWTQNRHRYQRNLMEDEEIKSTHIIIKNIYQKITLNTLLKNMQKTILEYVYRFLNKIVEHTRWIKGVKKGIGGMTKDSCATEVEMRQLWEGRMGL